MQENKVFSYQYSASKANEVERIRRKYLPKGEDKLEQLKRLDRRAQTAGMIESLSLGMIGCLIFGVGMCFGLDVLSGADWLTVLFGAVGAVTMLPAYPLYKVISRRTREKLAPEILKLADEIEK